MHLVSDIYTHTHTDVCVCVRACVRVYVDETPQEYESYINLTTQRMSVLSVENKLYLKRTHSMYREHILSIETPQVQVAHAKQEFFFICNYYYFVLTPQNYFHKRPCLSLCVCVYLSLSAFSLSHTHSLSVSLSLSLSLSLYLSLSLSLSLSVCLHH
jgi:hypothetical protein